MFLFFQTKTKLFFKAEEWLSGRKRIPAKDVGGQLPRGFESLLLRFAKKQITHNQHGVNFLEVSIRLLLLCKKAKPSVVESDTLLRILAGTASRPRSDFSALQKSKPDKKYNHQYALDLISKVCYKLAYYLFKLSKVNAYEFR